MQEVQLMRYVLSARFPFSLPAVAESHGWVQLPPFDWDADAGRLTRVERLSSGCVLELGVAEQDDGVQVQVADGLTEAEGQEVVERVRWMLDLDQDLSAFYALARDEARLAHLEGTAKGRILRSSTLFEDVVKTILTTNVQWSGTIRMTEALVAGFGAPLPADPARRAFPTPQRLAAADEVSLRGAGLGYRAPYVLELARSVATGAVDLEGLREAELPTTDVRNRLLAIKGVGDYAAASLLMLLGRYDVVPVDSWARTMVSRQWHGGEPVGRAQVEAAFEPWGPWKGLAYWFWDWGAA
jgi:3-methyladenine DNA glycosylase/8-oxoguanine DNA glycosylase